MGGGHERDRDTAPEEEECTDSCDLEEDEEEEKEAVGESSTRSC